MPQHEMISAEEFCSNYNVEFSFIHSLQENGLIEIVTLEEKGFIPTDQLKELERLARLHYELDINLEGIEAISHLLARLKDMHQHIMTLKNKLRLYENI